MELDEINLTSTGRFWGLPEAERQQAFAQLRAEEPIRFFTERAYFLDGKEVFPAGPGYWALTRHADVVEAGRRDDPQRFDVRRSPNNHIGFGGPGPHFCMGAHLARREIGVMFRELLKRFPQIRATAEPERLRSNFINGIKHLPCTLA